MGKMEKIHIIGTIFRKNYKTGQNWDFWDFRNYGQNQNIWPI